MPSLGLALRRRWIWALAAALGVGAFIVLPELTRPPAVHTAGAGLLVGDLRAFASRLPAELVVDSPAGLVSSATVSSLAVGLMLAFPDGKGLEKPDDELLAARMPPDGEVAALRGRLRVGYQDDRVVASAASADLAVRAANAWARAAVIVVRDLPKLARHLLAIEIERIRSRVEAAELQAGPLETRRVEAVRRLVALDAAGVELARRLEEVRVAQDRAIARIRAVEVLEHRLRDSLPAGPEEDGLSSPLLDRLKREREEIRAEIALKKLDRAPGTPEAERLQGRLRDVREEIRKELGNARDQTILRLRNSVDELDAELRSLDERRLRFSLERRELQEEAGLRDPALEELQGWRAQAAAAAEEERKLDVAVAPVTRGAPAERAVSSGGIRLGVLAGGGAAGLLAGLGLALLLQSLDRKVRTDADLRRVLQLPTIARVPESGEPLLRGAFSEGPTAPAFSLAAGVLRTYLDEREFRTLLVTSAAAGEGRTTCAVNLAVSFARKGLSVALVDAELAVPRLGALFGMDESVGLASVLKGEEIPPELSAPWAELPTLYVLPAGPASELGPEALESGRFLDLLRALRERHEAVIVKGPPIGEGGAAVTLAGLCDTVVWTIRSGAWNAGGLGWTKQVLRNVRADVAGAILTFAPADAEDPG